MKKKILVAEDDSNIRSGLLDALVASTGVVLASNFVDAAAVAAPPPAEAQGGFLQLMPLM